MKAVRKNYRQSPRKVRLVADAVKGKRVSDALASLRFMPKRAGEIIAKMIASASASAENNFKMNPDDLVVKSIRVDQGTTLKRIRPVSRGRAHPINKRQSNIVVELEAKN